MEVLMYCKTCSKRKTCKEICENLEKYLRNFTAFRKEGLSLYQDNAGNTIDTNYLIEKNKTYPWVGTQDKDFIDANLGWD